MTLLTPEQTVRIQREIQDLCREDFMSISDLFGAVSDELPGEPDRQVRVATEELIERLVRDGHISIGTIDGRALLPIAGSAEAQVRALRNAWDALHSPRPKLGELFWIDYLPGGTTSGD